MAEKACHGFGSTTQVGLTQALGLTGGDMESFEFTVNDSFLEGSGHPITIPKSQLQYKALVALGLDHKHMLVVLPHGERFEAEIYHGEAGYGEYYQLRFNGSNRTLPGYLKLNDSLLVFLAKSAGQSYALVEYRA